MWCFVCKLQYITLYMYFQIKIILLFTTQSHRCTMVFYLNFLFFSPLYSAQRKQSATIVVSFQDAFFQFVWLFRDRPLECRLNLQLFLNGTVLIFNGWSNAGFALVFSISNPSDILYHAVDREKQQAFERTILCNRTMRKCNNQHTMQQSHMPHILF